MNQLANYGCQIESLGLAFAIGIGQELKNPLVSPTNATRSNLLRETNINNISF